MIKINATILAIPSAITKEIQIPFRPIIFNRTKASGSVMINCLNNDIVNERCPLPNDSKTPEMTTPNVDRIKHGEIIRRPIIPISNKLSVALNHDKTSSGREIKIIVPKHKIAAVDRIDTLIIFLTRSKCLAPKL